MSLIRVVVIPSQRGNHNLPMYISPSIGGVQIPEHYGAPMAASKNKFLNRVTSDLAPVLTSLESKYTA